LTTIDGKALAPVTEGAGHGSRAAAPPATKVPDQLLAEGVGFEV
jgi:hypothetical protein